jgi:large subunit ribosomal protein L6
MGAKTERVVEIPEGIQAEVEGPVVKIKGEKGELSRDFSCPNISLSKEGDKILVKTNLDQKQERAIVGTYQSHIQNMVKGVSEGFMYKMKVVFSHFPMTLKQKENLIEINNFLGEKAPRHSKIVGDTKVDLGKDEVIIESINKEEAGQTAANLELATRVKKKDTRVFQDGVYLTEKPK